MSPALSFNWSLCETYLENELNQLMHEKKKNESKAKEEFDARVKEAKQKAIEDNKLPPELNDIQN